MRRALLLSLFFVAVSGTFAHAQFQPQAGPGSAFSIPQDALLQPDQLNALLQKSSHQPPLILQVGSHLMFAEAHIAGAEYAGPGSQAAGLDILRKRISTLPKNKLIVLYCGCCPWDRCPNVGPAFRELQNAGFTNVRVLYLAHNFGDDWVARGFNVEKGR